MMKRIGITLALIVGLALAWLLWELHPWMQAGKAVHIGSWQLAGSDFQVWQRKNQDTFEPFATGLFVRMGTNQWRVFCLDFQDDYRPKIELRAEGAEVVVLRKGKKMGGYDTTKQVFRRAGDGAEPHTVLVTNEPPSDWWLK